jgi:hypothetical protein
VLSLSERQAALADKGVTNGNTQVDTAAPSPSSSTAMPAAPGTSSRRFASMQVHRAS